MRNQRGTIEPMNVLITGASGGLGSAVVRAFVESGAAVYGVDRAWRETPARCTTISADLTTAAGCNGAVKAVLEHGPLDALVHLLGGFSGGRPVAETDIETWDRMINLNVRSAFLMFHAALPSMLSNGRGRILAIGSRVAVEPVATLSAYGVSKAGLVALIRTLALELKDTGITANAVLPSTIDTPGNRAAMPNADFSKWVKPESIASLLVWLASDEAADVSGAVIPIYGKA